MHLLEETVLSRGCGEIEGPKMYKLGFRQRELIKYNIVHLRAEIKEPRTTCGNPIVESRLRGLDQVKELDNAQFLPQDGA